MENRAKPLLVTSAAGYGLVSLPLLFLPQEFLRSIGEEPSVTLVALVQVVAAALFGFAALNWMNRHARIGGIFGRPLLLGNFALAAVATPSLARVVLGGDAPPTLGAGLGLFGLCLLGFGWRLFGPTPVD